jgi:NADPH-dependent 2,4-dienoyl-CoA reductase/sulfur reductase-like enzyme
MREERAQVVIVGAGPAGLKAAISAARAGASVVVVDEHPQPGGQIFHQMPQEFALKNKKLMSSEFHRAQSLFSELSNLPIRYFFNSVVWGAFDERTLEIMDANGSFSLEGDAIILATGAFDRPVPVPGWTLPGVITVGGAQTLLKAQRLIVGRKILMAGTGPLQLVVASQLAKAGADIVAVSDPVPTRDLFQHTWSMLRAWPITRDGVGYRWNLLRKGVPWIAPSILVHIGGRDEVSSATISQVDKDWRPIAGTERTFEVDTVCIGYGLVPSIELPRLLGCEFHYEEFADAWLPDRDEYFQTTTPNLYAVGDGSGIAGAAVAAVEGTIAGLTVAHRLKHISDTFFRDAIAEPRRRLERLAAFRLAMDTVYRPRPGLHELAHDDTVICRCEEVRLLHLMEAIDDGAETVGQVKAWTRAGMGPCQGRMCSLPVTHVIANKKNKHPRSIGLQTALVPAKPVSVHSLIKDVVLTFPEDLVLGANHINSSNDPKE